MKVPLASDPTALKGFTVDGLAAVFRSLAGQPAVKEFLERVIVDGRSFAPSKASCLAHEA